MKILILNWRDIKHPLAGGSEIYFHEMAKRWAKKGHKITWVGGGWKNCKKEENIDGISIKRIGREKTLYLFAPFCYLKLKEKPNLIIDIENGIPFFTPLFSRKRKILHIHHIHKDVWFKESENRSMAGKIIALTGFFLETKIMPIIYRKTKVVTLSKSSAEEIKKEKIGNVIGIVNPGFDVQKKLNIKKEKFPVVLFINRIKRYKGIDTLIKAFSRVCNEKIMQNAQLYIVGKGDYEEEIKKIISDNKKIKMLGYVDKKRKYELMKKAWIFVNPSFKEGWGIVNIEAASFGLPVIGSNVSGVKDSVVDGKTGLLFEYGNANELAEKILLLIKNKKLREKMAKNGKKWAKKFTWERAANEYLKISKTYLNFQSGKKLNKLIRK